MSRLNNVQDLQNLRQQSRQALAQMKSTATIISIGMGTCGIAAGAREVYQAIEAELAKRQIEAQMMVVGCIGICVKEPLVDIQQAGGSRVLYANIRPEMVPRLIEQHLIGGQPIREWVVGRIVEQ